MRERWRGVKAPPDSSRSVAIDDAIVNVGGTYPLPRAEIAKIVEAIARLEPKVIAIDLPGRQWTRRRRCGTGESARGASDRACGGGGIFQHRSAFRRTTGHWPPAEGRPFPAADPLLCRPRGSRYRQCVDGQTGTPMSVPMLFRTSDKIELSFPLRVASVAIGQKLTIEPDRLLFGDRPIATASDYALPISYYGP